MLILAYPPDAARLDRPAEIGFVRIDIDSVDFGRIQRRNLGFELTKRADRDMARQGLSGPDLAGIPRPVLRELQVACRQPGRIRKLVRQWRYRQHRDNLRIGLEHLATRNAAIAQHARLEACRRYVDRAMLLRVKCIHSLDDVVWRTVDDGFIATIVACQFAEHLDAADGGIAQGRLPRRYRPVDLHGQQNLRLYISLGEIHLARHEDFGFAGRRVTRLVHRDRERCAALGADRHRWNRDSAGPLGHEDVCPGLATPNLAVDDRRVAELATLTDIEVGLECRDVRLQIDIRIRYDLERKRLIEVDIQAVDAGCHRRKRLRAEQRREDDDHGRIPEPGAYHGCTSSSGQVLLPSWSLPVFWY